MGMFYSDHIILQTCELKESGFSPFEIKEA